MAKAQDMIFISAIIILFLKASQVKNKKEKILLTIAANLTATKHLMESLTSLHLTKK